MPYATVTDVNGAWPRIFTTGLVADELRTLIDRASHVVDGYLARTYTVPFCTEPTSAPPLIRDLVCDLAMVDVFDRSPNAPEWVVRRIERAYNTLQKLADGDMGLVGADGAVLGELTTVDVPRSNTSGYVPIFGAEPSLAERLDPARATAEANARGSVGAGWED